MEIEQVAELARAIAALPQGQQEFFYGMVADERAKAAEAERIAKLRGMSDFGAVRNVLEECTEHAELLDADEALKMLREAGFIRGSAGLARMRDAYDKLEAVLRAIVDTDGGLPGSKMQEVNGLLMQAATSLSLVESEEF